MKKTTWFYFFLLMFFMFCSCATQLSAGKIEEVEKSAFPVPVPPEAALLQLTGIEQVLRQIKQNGTDIEKYFVLDENGWIIVKADLQNEKGDFEVIYDLEQAKALGNSVFEISFILHEKKTEVFIKDSLIWRPLAGNAGILLSFDDDYVKTWEQYLDLFDKYEARVTFFLQGEFHPFSAKALNRGHDVGFHTLNHPDLRRIPQTDFFKETIEAAESYRREGVPVSSFAYPFGFSEPWMHTALLQSFDVLRGYGVTFRIYNVYEIKSSFISSRAIDNTVLRSDENFDRVITSMLRTVKFLDGNWVLPLTSHDISDAAWAISPRRLEFLLRMAADLRLKFYRFRDISDLTINQSK